jgi:site-specific DNA recombinase
MSNRVAIYARISSDREKNKNGVDMQVKECLAKAKADGLEVTHTFVDNDVSATDRKAKRPEWQKLLKLIETDEIDGILCWHPDRLYRRLTELEVITDQMKTRELRKKEFKIHCVTAGLYNLSDPTGVLVAGIIASTAKYEVQHKSERQRARHEQIAADGLWHGGKLPTGYKKGEGKGQLAIDEPIADALRTSAKLLLSGHSLRSVTRVYQETTGHMMADTALRRVLVGPVIAGIRIYSPEHSRDDKARMQLPDRIVRVPAQWDAILDEETWLDLKALLLNPKRNTRGITSELSLLSGVLVCGRSTGPHTVCGKSLGYGQKAYICNYSSGGCNKMSISTARIEEFIEGQVSAMIHEKDYLMPSSKAKTEDEATRIKRERLQKNYDDSFEMFVQGTVDREHLEAAKARLGEQLDKLGPKTKSAAAVEAENAELTSLIAHWDQAGRPEKRMVIRHLIDRVMITAPNPERAKAHGGRFDFERAEIQWAKYEDGVRQPPVKLKVKSNAAEARDRR